MAHAQNDEELESKRRQRSEAHTGQTFRRFVDEVRHAANLEPKRAEEVAVSVVCLLEQRIVDDEAEDMNAQLPAKFRELVQRCDRHRGQLRRKFSEDEFAHEIARELSVQEYEARGLIRAVFSVLAHRVSEGEIDQVVRMLPRDFRELWPTSVQIRAQQEEEQERFRTEREHKYDATQHQ